MAGGEGALRPRFTGRDAAIRSLVVGAAWGPSTTLDPDPDLLQDALALARRNEVEALIVQSWPGQFDGLGARIDAAVVRFEANLRSACRLLAIAGVAPILIKTDPGLRSTYTNFDLMVGGDWPTAVAALDDWAIRWSGHPLEPDKVLAHPPTGPAAHLHQDVAWFGIPVIADERVRARARPEPGGEWFRPHPDDELRIVIAHAVFQNLGFDLADLRLVRSTWGAADGATAAALADREGWGQAFRGALAVALAAIDRLDRGELDGLPLPLPLPIGLGLAAGYRHAAHLVRARQPRTAIREALLRLPLVAMKRRHFLEPGNILGAP